MAGIYIHIPFCRKACTYCDFHFSTNLSRKDEMVSAIQQEILLRRDYLPNSTTIQSIYFGGGTPSVLDGSQISEIIQTVQSVWKIEPNAEITLEANPDDLGQIQLLGLRDAGVNRLSIGIQSFREADLQQMNRSHHAQQAIDAVRMAQEVGFGNITIDLIYGIPGLSMEDWKANLEQALALNVPHVSAYALTVEPKTALAHQVKKKEISIPSDQIFELQYTALIDRLAKHGILQYELSNFAIPGMEAVHNGSYWKGAKYLGVGPSAHSFDGNSRHWNYANNTKYLAAIRTGELPVASLEILSETDKLNEYLMTGLRKVEGINWESIRQNWGIDVREIEADFVNECLHKGFATETNQQFQLTTLGFLVSDHIISNLFQVS